MDSATVWRRRGQAPAPELLIGVEQEKGEGCRCSRSQTSMTGLEAASGGAAVARAVGVTELGEAVDNLAQATEDPLDRLGAPRRWGRLVASTGHRQRPGASVLAGGCEG